MKLKYLPFCFRAQQVTGLILTATLGIFSSIVLAQVDAGALQQGLEKQLPMPSPLALPEPTMKEPLRPSAPKQGVVTFEVKSFVLEGVSTLPEASVQEVLKLLEVRI